MTGAAAAPLMIETSQALAEVCERIARAPRVGLDTEFHNERSYTARLMVVQIAFDDGVAIVDPLAVADLSPLSEALARTTVTGHALSSDLKIFADRFDRVPPNVFDCQIAASFLGFGLSISLADLVRQLRRVRLKKLHTVSDWSKRPLSAGQLEYLVEDVIHLLPMQDELTRRLEGKRRYEWSLEEFHQLADIARYRTDARRMYARIPGSNRMSRRELGVLSELVQLRDRLARQRDVPVRFIMPDDVLAAIVTLKPKKPEDLAQLRRFDAGGRRGLAAAIIDAVKRADALPDDALPPKFAHPLGTSRDALVSLMSVVVAEIARENEIPSSLLAPRAALDRVGRELPPNRDALLRALDLTAWRAELLGARLWALLSGDGALRVKGYAEGDPQIFLQP